MIGVHGLGCQGIGAALNISGGNKVLPPQWDDFRSPANGTRLDVSSGRLDYNFSECFIEFQPNARYPDEPVSIVAQMPHRYKLGSNIRPHVHWIQTTGVGLPNWLLAYRVYELADIVPAFSLVAASSPEFTYPGSGSFNQYSAFGEIDMSGVSSVSAVIDFILYRDSNNTSGLFSGVDTYSADANLKEFDFHYQVDSAGSTEEFVK